ncbi:IPT/TIG domain-containing protein [Geothrix sp. 21YS21S-2]|uniref:IPT/TIG domain-containing protein n=1 Tax=Geothrix sp. 21YS21S-2 TaxID=3068893 RepID=UPI0027B9EA77|nr:IPT/TIG domain-containing protein [Geothrix sp. 21YS21S-2]
MVGRNCWSMVTVACLVGAVGCHKSSNPAASSIPVITSFTPSQGLTGSAIELTGSGFDGTTTVSVGGATADWKRHSNTSMTVTVPDQAMSGVIAVVNSLGSGGSTSNFNVIPTVTAISPTSGSPGTTVTLTGTGFTGAQIVKFGTGPAANFYVNSSTQLQAVVPLGSSTGPITVTTNTAGVQLTATSPTFTYSGGGVEAPVLTSFAPSQAGTGDYVVLAGSGFTGVSGATIGGISSYFSVTSDTVMSVQVPSAAASGFIQLTGVLGTATSAARFLVTPTLSAFTPATGPSGTLVTLTGTGFSGATQVTFGNAVASSFIVIDSNTIKANVKAGSATGVITVATNGLTCSSSSNFTFVPDAVNKPAVTGIAPQKAAVGETVTLTGTGFTGVTKVTVGGADAPDFTVASDTTLTVKVPAAAAAGFISVTNALGSDSSPSLFTVNPSITSLSALSGKVGATITITGTGFSDPTSSGNSTLVFGSGPNASFIVVGPNTITATVPAGATTGVVTFTAFGTAAASTDTFTVLP